MQPSVSSVPWVDSEQLRAQQTASEAYGAAGTDSSDLTYFPENLGKLCAFLQPMWVMCLQNPVKDSEQTNGEEIWKWKISILHD